LLQIISVSWRFTPGGRYVLWCSTILDIRLANRGFRFTPRLSHYNYSQGQTTPAFLPYTHESSQAVRPQGGLSMKRNLQIEILYGMITAMKKYLLFAIGIIVAGLLAAGVLAGVPWLIVLGGGALVSAVLAHFTDLQFAEMAGVIGAVALVMLVVLVLVTGHTVPANYGSLFGSN
jgi:hypothetical protein